MAVVSSTQLICNDMLLVQISKLLRTSEHCQSVWYNSSESVCQSVQKWDAMHSVRQT